MERRREKMEKTRSWTDLTQFIIYRCSSLRFRNILSILRYRVCLWRKSTELGGRDLNALHTDELAVKMFIRSDTESYGWFVFYFHKKSTEMLVLRVFNVIGLRGLIGYTSIVCQVDRCYDVAKSVCTSSHVHTEK